MNEYDAKVNKLIKQLGLDDFSDFRFIQRQEVTQCRQVGIKLILYIEEKMKKLGMSWGLYTADYYLQNKDVLRGYGKPSESKVVETMERIVEELSVISREIERLANQGMIR